MPSFWPGIGPNIRLQQHHEKNFLKETFNIKLNETRVKDLKKRDMIT
jgi:hypothetical protein